MVCMHLSQTSQTCNMYSPHATCTTHIDARVLATTFGYFFSVPALNISKHSDTLFTFFAPFLSTNILIQHPQQRTTPQPRPNTTATQKQDPAQLDTPLLLLLPITAIPATHHPTTLNANATTVDRAVEQSRCCTHALVAWELPNGFHMG